MDADAIYGHLPVYECNELKITVFFDKNVLEN